MERKLQTAAQEQGVRITRATLALMVATLGPVSALAVSQYQVNLNRVEIEEQADKIRDLELAVVRFESTTEAVNRQTAAIEKLEAKIDELSKAMGQKKGE